MNKPHYNVIWQAQEGPQSALVACPVFEVFYGGARGGGKTDGMLGDWLEHQQTWGGAANGVFFRRTLPQLSEVIARAFELFDPLGAVWNEQKKRFRFPNGARLSFRFLERDRDAENYQGHSYTRVYIEEATNFPSPAPIDKLRATIRSTRVPAHGLGMRLTGNPGGPGHSWVKKRYIEPAPQGYKVIPESFTNPFNKKEITIERVFIPAKVSDNKLLMEVNPQYVAQLQQSGSKQLVQAWLHGLWDIIDGAFFAEFDPAYHVLEDSLLESIPPHAAIFRALDWGYARPFSVGWYAVCDGKWDYRHPVMETPLPRGSIVKIGEWYGCTGRPNEGVRMEAGTVGAGIVARDKEYRTKYGWKVKYGTADPSIFIRDGGPSIMELMLKEHCIWGRADNKRDSGWLNVRQRLAMPQGRMPYLYFLENCYDTIRCFPLAQHDEKKAEDLDTDGEDHALDETRYAMTSRPFVIDAPVQDGLDWAQLSKAPGQLTFNDVLAMNRKKRLAAASW